MPASKGGAVGPGPRWLAVATLSLVIAAARPPRLLPESHELVATGRCLLGMTSVAPPCADLDLFFWSPLYPLLSALASLVVEPLVAGGLVALLSFAALLLVAGRLAERLAGPPAWWATVLALAVSSSTSSYAMIVDARALGLALATGAILTALPPGRPADPHPRRRAGRPLDAALAGLLAAGAALTRPEHALIAAGVLLLLATRHPRHVPPALAGMSPLALWVGLQSAAEGHLAPLPRSIQGVGFALTQVVPEPWARQLIGEGAASLPMRQAIRSGPWPQDLPAGFGLDIASGLLWMFSRLGQLLPLWSLPLSLLGLGLLARRGSWRSPLALLVLASPGLAAVATPPGQEAELPVATLLPAVVASVIAASAAAPLAARAALGRRAPLPLRSGLAALLGAVLGLASPALDFPLSPENTPAGRAAATDLARRFPAGSPVAASFAASPIVHLAGMRWVPWPSPWEAQRWLDPDRAPVAAVLTVADEIWSPADPGLPSSRRLRPVAAYGEGGSGVLLLAVESDSP